MKNNLPTGWEYKKLGLIADINIGKTPPRSNPEYFKGTNVWLSIRDMKTLFINESSEKLTNEALEKFNIKVIKQGALLMSFKLTLGKLAFANCDLYTNEAIASLPINKNFINTVDKKYLFFALQFIDLEVEMDNAVKGKTLNKEKLKNLNIPIPPILEQKELINILEKSFEKIDNAIVLVKQNIEKIKQLNESAFNELFEIKNLNWNKSELQNLTTKIGSGSTPTGGYNSYKSSGIHLIRSMNVHDGGFREKGIAFIDETQAKKLNNVQIESNDVLLNITGASVERCCIVPEKYLPARVNQHVSILRVNQKIITPQFLYYCLISPFYKKQLLLKSGGGATREALSKAMLEKFQIGFPDLEEQQRIVSHLDRLTQNNSQLLQHYQKKLEALQRLKNSVLESAFKGEFKKEPKAKSFNLAFYQMQLIGLSIDANKHDNIPQGEMAIAKDMYLLDRLFQVPTKMNFVNHSWGPFAPEIKKGITNKTYFGKKNFPNSKATYVVTQNDEALFKTVSAELKSQVFIGINELNSKVFFKVSMYKRAETKELLATVLKCIEDTQSIDLSVIRQAMQNWKIEQGEYKTKAEKFSENRTQLVIKFIVKEDWHLKVLK